MRCLIILAVFVAINVCLIAVAAAKAEDELPAVAAEADIKNAELNALLAADTSNGVHDNQSGREARQFFSPFFFRRPFFGGGFRRGGFGGFGRRRFYRRRRFGGFYG